MTTKSTGEFSFKVEGTNLDELRSNARKTISEMMGDSEPTTIEYDIRVEVQTDDGTIHLWAATVTVYTDV